MWIDSFGNKVSCSTLSMASACVLSSRWLGTVMRTLGFRQYLWSDAVYVRSWMDLSVLSYEKLVHFAIIAHDLLHSFDLTHLILSELETRVEERFTSKYLEKISRQGSGTLSKRSQPNGGAMSQEPRRTSMIRKAVKMTNP
jgi:hypothetical protein